MRLVYIELILISIVLISAVLLQNTSYGYDETIVTSISKQPAELLMQTIKYEPHPFGLYFLLKLINVDSANLTRIFAILVSMLLLSTSIFWADKRGIILKYKLSFGLLV